MAPPLSARALTQYLDKVFGTDKVERTFTYYLRDSNGVTVGKSYKVSRKQREISIAFKVIETGMGHTVTDANKNELFFVGSPPHVVLGETAVIKIGLE